MKTSTSGYNPQSSFQSFGPDLPFLASQAAIELDNLILGTSDSLTAVDKLASVLKNSVGRNPEVASQRNLLDPESICIFSHAYAEIEDEPVNTIDELAGKAWRVASNLDEVREKAVSEQGDVRKLRSFCVALSKIAMAQRITMMERRPGSPFRR